MINSGEDHWVPDLGLAALVHAAPAGDPRDMDSDEMRVVATFAALASCVQPSPPWQFTSSRHTIEVHADLERRADYFDRRGRQIYLACGEVSELARLGIRSLGRACTVKLLPSDGDDSLVATLTVGSSEATTPIEHRLIDAAPRRSTDFGRYSDIPVSRVALQRVREVAFDRGCWLRVLDQPDDRLAATTLRADAEDLIARNPEYGAGLELQPAVSLSGQDPAGTDPTDRSVTIPRYSRRAPDSPMRSPDSPAPADAVALTVMSEAERTSIIVLGTDSDDPRAWLRAGRAIADLLLVLTDAGLVSAPLGPVVDLPVTRARLRHELGLIGYPQLMLRIGYRQPHTTQVLDTADDMVMAAKAP